jgi:hypothetical protein
MSEQTNPETFAEFKTSFSYGSRTDLNFKFLKGLPEAEAAQFFQDLLWKLGDFLDDGDASRLANHVRDWQAQGYAAPTSWAYDDSPFTPLTKPLNQTRLALITSSGHFVAGHDPEPFGVPDMSQEEAAKRISEFLREQPGLSAIPVATTPEALRVRHGGYDIRGAQADHNVVLPLERLRDLAAEGVLDLHDTAYSFVGATAQNRLMKDAGPQWVSQFLEEGIEAALLVPV